MKQLQIIERNILADYKKQLMNIEADNDEFYQKTPHRLLDNFSHALTVEEMENIPFNFYDLNLQNEYKYRNLFKELFNRNSKSEIVAVFDYRGMNASDHLRVINDLDLYEKALWVDQMLYLDQCQITNYFIVKDIEVLMMLIQLNVRELEFVEIHFLDLGYVFKGTYDCAMEVFFDEESKIQELESIASNYKLYLRKYEE